jgi:hypothetical protein
MTDTYTLPELLWIIRDRGLTLSLKDGRPTFRGPREMVTDSLLAVLLPHREEIVTMLSRERSKCRSCGAAVIWCETKKGKRMPLDAEPCEAGTFTLGAEGVAVYQKWQPERLLYQSHYSSCPNAAQHRKE